MIEKLDMRTPDFSDKNIELISRLFPNCITEQRDEKGTPRKAIDFDLLRQELSKDIVEGTKERYRLEWPGKKEALLLANTPINKTLRPIKDDSVNFDTTQNLYIEGDNLDALKLLQESYLNKVKMIYIDPPYNTGKDFVYKDNFTIDKEEELKSSGQMDEYGNRLIKNVESNGRYHSDWLSMMYPRLKLARNLLRDDGVIFISIDDHEVHNLRKICDEIFGERNFVCEFVWAGKSGSEDDSHIRNNKEYILCFAKRVNQFEVGYDLKKEEKFNLFDSKKNDFYKRQLLRKWGDNSKKEDRPNLHYAIQDDDGKIFFPKLPNGEDGCWRWSKETMQLAIKESRIEFAFNSKGIKEAYEKIYQSEERNNNKKFQSLLYELGSSAEGTKEAKNLFNDNKIFSNPKPTKLLKRLCKIAGLNSSDIILDFFSGSATTAHAVMQINSEDGGNRKFIMVQIPEPTDEDSEAYKAGYKNIYEIGKERIRRAGAKIIENIAQESSKKNDLFNETKTAPSLDIGFRVLRVDSSNMKDVYYSPDETKKEDMLSFVSDIKDDRTDLDLIYQVMLDSGVELALSIEERYILDKLVYFVGENILAACFATDLNKEFFIEFAKQSKDNDLLKVVFRDSSFDSDDTRINVEQIFRQYSPSTQIRVI
ncbi:site-specific DNA-methyltransferase [Thermodesulfobium sp. 4217-1]|uniref:site-specific DNA-methyltransferase n=1 Tax=Thermodesulfobium sp. 4217-1 TaxID=3120013 RepID=UPI0032217841